MNDLTIAREGQGYRIFLSAKTGLFWYVRLGESTFIGPFISDYHAAEDFHMATIKVVAHPTVPNVVYVDFVARRRV